MLSIFALGCVAACAQGGERSLFPTRERPEDVPKGVKESREKIRIEKEQKDYDEMLERGEEVRRLTEHLEKSFAQNGRFSDTDLSSLEAIEKATKKIRSELGGSDDDEKIDDILGRDKVVSLAEAVNTLKSAVDTLVEELKKSNRFTVSAAAIQSTNAVVTVARFLRVKN